jgi:Cu/Ag efflux pump CusA
MEQAAGLPMLTVEPNRAQLGRYGMSVSSLQDTVAAALGGRDGAYCWSIVRERGDYGKQI